MTRLHILPALLVILAISLCAADQTIEGPKRGGSIRLRKLLQDVSIFDGTLASPSLGPQAAEEAAAILSPGGLVPSPQEALVFAPLTPILLAPAPGPSGLPAGSSGKTVSTGGSSCGRNCLIGSIFGAVLGSALLACLLLYLCCRRRDITSREILSTGDLELLEDQARVASGNTPLKYQAFALGDHVFCKRGRHCIAGHVTSQEKGNAYKVLYRDGSEEVVENCCMAPDYQAGTVVMYSPPQGGGSITGSILNADGSFWPPFYQLRPHNGKTDSIDTTAEYLSQMRTPRAHGLSYISADASTIGRGAF